MTVCEGEGGHHQYHGREDDPIPPTVFRMGGIRDGTCGCGKTIHVLELALIHTNNRLSNESTYGTSKPYETR